MERLISIVAGVEQCQRVGSAGSLHEQPLKQIQLALNMFVLDNEDYLPPYIRAYYAKDPEKWKNIVQ